MPMITASGKLLGTLSVYYRDSNQLDKGEGNLVKRVGVFLQLIIESQLTKERLLVSNERYKHITNATNDATYDWDIETGFIYWGEGENRLFGYQNHKSTIEDWGNRIDPDEKPAIDKSLTDALADPNVNYWHGEYRYRRSDGLYAYVIEDGYISRNSQGHPIRMVGALKDVSALKEKENKILKQNKRLQQIATINSHHIRKPLANILGIIEALKYSEEESREELITMLDVSGLELDKIVRKIAKKTLV
jgi:PAS domain S-box-containing protein